MILKKSKLTYICWVLFIVLGFGSLYVASGKYSFLLSVYDLKSAFDKDSINGFGKTVLKWNK